MRTWKPIGGMNNTIVRGRVINGVSRSGFEGVPVSNGEEIVETGEDGVYKILVKPGVHTFVFLTLPDGFRARNGFYRSLDVGRSVRDFSLTGDREEDGRELSMAQITDTHLTLEGEKIWTGNALREDLEIIYRCDAPDMVVATGDLTSRGEVAQLQELKEIIGGSPIRVVPVFGGHDGNAERHSGCPGETFVRNWEKVFGPICFSFNRRGRHFIAYAGEDYFFSPDDARRKNLWLRRDLEMHDDGGEIIVFMHTPPTEHILDMLSDFNVGLVLYGHWHSSKVFRSGQMLVASTPPLTFGGIDTSSRGYRLVEFGERATRVRLRDINSDGNSGGDGFMWGIPGARWNVKLPSEVDRASPVPTGEDLLLSVRDEDGRGRCGVLCVGASSGSIRWHTITDSSIKNSVALAREVCAAASVCGAIYMMDVSDGRVIWKRELPDHPGRWIYTSPIIEDGVVYSGAKAGYAALDAEDGSNLWYSELEANDAWPCYASPISHGEMVIVLVPRRGLLALRKEDGEIEWETKLPVEYYYSPHVVERDRVLTGGERGKLAILDAGTGEILWHGGELAGKYPTSLIMMDKRIFATTSNGYLQCNDVETGARTWTYLSGRDLLDMSPYVRGGRSVLAAPLIRGQEVVVCGCDGTIHILDKLSGNCLNRFELGSPVTAGPCEDDGNICIGTHAGDLYLFEWNDLVDRQV